MTLHGVIFDIGGVLFRTEDQAPRIKWEQHLGLKPGQLAEIVFGNTVSRKATLGEVRDVEVWNEVGRLLNLSPQDLALLQQDFFSGDRWDEGLLEYIRTLRPKYQTGILSNAWPDARNWFSTHINRLSFDSIVYSSEIRCKKPDEQSFRMAIGGLGLPAEEALFVDDFAENVAGAIRAGLQAILFRNSNEVIHEINERLSQR